MTVGKSDKRRGPGWLIGLVLVVLAVSTYRAISSPAGGGEAREPIEPAAGYYVPHNVRSLRAFVDSAGAVGHTHDAREFTAAGIRHVAAALGTVASASGFDISPGLYIVREQAAGIQQEPRSSERASRARATLETLAALLAAVQERQFPELYLEVGNVRRAASSLRVDQRLRDQQEVVVEFLKRAAAALGAMSDALYTPHAPRAVRTMYGAV
jgi:hypothetical protein